MAQETQVEKPAAPDTIQVVTSDSMQSFTEAHNAGEEFKETKADAPVVEAKTDAVEETPEPPVEVENATHEEGIWKPKEGKPLSKRQIEANERFAKVTKERNDAHAAAEIARQDAAALRAKYEAPAVVPQEEPNPENYTDAKLYANDVYEWKRGQERAAEFAAAKQREAASVQERFNKDRDAFKATVPDWDEREKVREGLKMHNEVISAIMDEDNPAAVLYALVPEEVARINAIPLLRNQIKEIARIADKVGKTAPVKTQAQASTVEVSQAPPPINPIKAVHQEPSNKVDKDGNYTGTQEELITNR
jgi:hypothetical protein